MSKKIFFVIPVFLALLVSSARFQQDQEVVTKPEIAEKKIENSDNHNHDTKHDNVKSLEKELKLQKAKRLKESNYRKILESILPVATSDGYEKIFEYLLKNSDDISILHPMKGINDFVVTNTFADSEKNEGTDAAEEEEVEIVIEHISSSGKNNETNNEFKESKTELPETSIANSDDTDLDSSVTPITPFETEIEKSAPRDSMENLVLNTKGRMGINVPESAETDSLLFSDHEERTFSEPQPPLNDFSKVTIHPYRRTMTSSGVVFNPTMYTMQTIPPIINQITSLNKYTNRATGPENFVISSSNSEISEHLVKFIDDYIDYNTNTYKYSPRRSNELEPAIPNYILSKLAEPSIQPNMNNQILFKNRMYPAASYFPQVYRFPATSRSYYRFYK